jgi:hypothetical protein
VPAGANDLTTVNTALAWLSVDSDDGFGTLQRLITAISTAIQNHISRTIKSTAYSITLNGRGRHRIMLPNWPITAVASVNIVLGSFGAMNIPARSVNQFGQANSPGYCFDDKFLYVDPPYCFEKGAQNVQISYTAGYATVPLDIEQACLIWIKTVLDSSNYSAALKLAKAGATQLDFSFVMTNFLNRSVPIPPGVIAMLRGYEKVVPTW